MITPFDGNSNKISIVHCVSKDVTLFAVAKTWGNTFTLGVSDCLHSGPDALFVLIYLDFTTTV